MSQSPDENRRLTGALDAEGVRAVRRALERSRAGPPGLYPHRKDMGDAEFREGMA